MYKDPIVEEVRQIRREIERQCGSYPDAYYEHLERLQQQWQARLVRREPKMVRQEKIAS